MSFYNRIEKGKSLEKYLENLLEDFGVEYIRSGQEFYKDEKNEYNRYNPDFTVCTPILKKQFFLEVKNSTGIEEEAYNHYKSIQDNTKYDVYLFLLNKKFCKFYDLKLKKIDTFDHKSGLEIPIKDEVFKQPRLLNEKDYRKYLKAYDFRTSGCSFAYIDFENTKYIDIVEEEILSYEETKALYQTIDKEIHSLKAQNEKPKEEANRIEPEQKEVRKEDDDFPFEDGEEDSILDVAKERENDDIIDMAILDADFKRDKNNKRYLYIEIAPVSDPDKVRKLAIHQQKRMEAIAKNLSSKLKELPGRRVKVKVKRNRDSFNDYYFSFEPEFKKL